MKKEYQERLDSIPNDNFREYRTNILNAEEETNSLPHSIPFTHQMQVAHDKYVFESTNLDEFLSNMLDFHKIGDEVLAGVLAIHKVA
jgi:exosome complex RNA-binding protein Csl4